MAEKTAKKQGNFYYSSSLLDFCNENQLRVRLRKMLKWFTKKVFIIFFLSVQQLHSDKSFFLIESFWL